MYALGVLLDSQPELLFTLRSIDSASLLRKPEHTSDAFDAASLSATFGIDLELP
jgi:hypothetical protein